MATVLDFLKNLELSQKEAQVYMACMRLGPSSASLLAKRAEIKRVTVYPVLNSLAKKGFVQRVQSKGVDFYKATDPETLNIALDTETQRAIRKLERKKEALKTVMPMLRSLALPYESYPKVRFIEGARAVGDIYNEALDTDNGFSGLFDPEQAFPIIEDQIRKMIERSNKQKSHIQDIGVSGPCARKYKSWIKNRNHKLKTLPKKTKVSGDYILTKKALYLIGYDPHPVAVVVESDEIVSTQHVMFNLIWNCLK